MASLAGTVAAALACGTAFAADVWPAKPVKLVVPLAPGGTADATARILSEKLTILWGQPVVVENRAGGNGIIGMEAVARAAPDGYTLGMGNINTQTTNQLIYHNLPYDPVKSFVSVAWLTTSPLFLIVHPSVPAKTLPEFLAYARAHPDTLTYATIGVGSSMHLAAEMLQQRTGIRMVHVPYKGMGAAIKDLVAGDVKTTLDISTMKMVKEGRLRAIAVASPHRYEGEPDIPSFKEGGLPDFELVTFLSLHAPAGTPQPIVAKINADVNKVLAMADVRERIEAMNLKPIGGTPQALSDFLAGERKKYAEVIRVGGIKVE